MKENIIDVKAETLPWQVKLIGVLFLVAALTVIANYWWLSIVLAVVGSTLLTTHSGTEINATVIRFVNTIPSVFQKD